MSELGIKELAESLGISVSSVSRALSNPERVSAKMRERVQAAAEAAGYRPNKLGASLRTSKTNNIIAIIPDISDTFIAGVIRSLERTATEHGYSVLFGDTHGSRERELIYGDMVKTRQADGIILFSHRLPFTDREIASEKFKLPPMVNSCESLCCDPDLSSDIPLVSIDNVAAGKEATEHLIGLGHTNIAVITGDRESPSVGQRLKGYQAALADAGIPFQEKLIYYGSYTLEAGRRITKEILQAKDRPTAIFCMCDEIAFGSMSTLKDNGFQVPEDISIIGVDGIRFAEYFSPSLTTIAQPEADIGRLCVEAFLDVVNQRPVEEKSIVLPHQLIVRNSTGPAPERR